MAEMPRMLGLRPATIDFSALANLGQIPERLRMRDLRNKFASGGITDFNAMVQALGAADPMAAAKLWATQGEDRYGLNPVFDAEGNAYQTNSAGGLSPLEVPGGGKLTAPQRWVETPEGYVPVPSRGPIGGSVQGPEPRPVPTMNVGPDGSMTPTAVPSLGSQKQKHELASTKATDQAMAQSAVAKFDEQVANFETLLDESGEGSSKLRSITGNRKVYGVETPIPNAWLPNVSQESRDASANLETAAVQVGLNTLAEMRAMSAQGASGMGQLAIKESEWLQNSIRSLRETQGTPQAAKHIREIIRYSKMVQAQIKEKYRNIYGEELPAMPGPPPEAATQPRSVPTYNVDPISGAMAPTSAAPAPDMSNASPYPEAGPRPSQNDMQMLRQHANNPEFRAEFERIYGAGSVDRWLGVGEWKPR